MLQSKNLSPRSLAFFTALVISAPIALIFFGLNHSFLEAIIFFIAILIGCYLVIFLTLERFIYRKIKLIYKLIAQTKASKREEFYEKNILPRKGIDDVREDVEKWALQRKRQIEMLEQNEQYRKEFLQNLSHELKTPIFAIQGYVDTLLNGALHDDNVNKKFLTNAAGNVDRLASLVNDLDEITRLESGNQPLQMTNFVIQDLVKSVYQSLEINAQKKSISLTIKKGCEAPLQVSADEAKIRQVLTNLVLNAIKYSSESAVVEASFYNIDKDLILIEITDTGFGIVEEHLVRIFERFYRTDAARSRNIGGSGLGLSICKHIVEAHGQSIHVRSKVNVGSTFGFTLPIKD